MTQLLAGAAGVAMGLWLGLHPAVQVLVVMMAIDIATGVLAARHGDLRSSRMFAGLRKKAIVLLLVAMGSLLGSQAGGLPIGEVVAGFYSAHEGLSVLENATRAGLPVPAVLRDALARVRSPEPPRG